MIDCKIQLVYYNYLMEKDIKLFRIIWKQLGLWKDFCSNLYSEDVVVQYINGAYDIDKLDIATKNIIKDLK